MVTGDRKETAVAIAREAGLLVKKEDVALTSAEMSAMSDEEYQKAVQLFMDSDRYDLEETEGE